MFKQQQHRQMDNNAKSHHPPAEKLQLTASVLEQLVHTNGLSMKRIQGTFIIALRILIKDRVNAASKAWKDIAGQLRSDSE